MRFPENIFYSKEHTWLQLEGNIGTVGITEFAQSELGEIVYVELPKVGQSFNIDDVFGTVEAVKTTSDLFMPVTGRITAINEVLIKKPELVNSDPFSEAWMVKIEISNSSEVDKLLSSENYKEIIGV